MKYLSALKTSGLLTLGLISTDVLAGSGVGTLTHVPYSESIPALGGTALIVLAALLGVVSLRFMKQREHSGTNFLVITTLVGAVAAAGSGAKLISDANAAPGVLMSNAQGGVLNIPFDGFNTVFNDTGRGQQISEINLNPGCEIEEPRRLMGNGGRPNGGGNGGNFAGSCSDNPGTVLGDGDFCELFICCDGPNGGENGGNNGGCFDI